MEAPASYPGSRPELVYAMAPRTAAMAKADHDLSWLGMEAVVVVFCPDLELFEVMRAFALQFGVEDAGVQVSVFTPREFLVVFDDMEARKMAVAWQGPLTLRSVLFMLSLWTRFHRAWADKLCYKVHVCLEGVPKQAWQPEAMNGLFNASDIIDCVDNVVYFEQETACFRLWV
jgi:hypothetical protein